VDQGVQVDREAQVDQGVQEALVNITQDVPIVLQVPEVLVVRVVPGDQEVQVVQETLIRMIPILIIHRQMIVLMTMTVLTS
jgi:hypothetical protein